LQFNVAVYGLLFVGMGFMEGIRLKLSI